MTSPEGLEFLVGVWLLHELGDADGRLTRQDRSERQRLTVTLVKFGKNSFLLVSGPPVCSIYERAEAEAVIRKVVEGRIILMPEEDDTARCCRFTGQAGIGRLILATPVAKKVVTQGVHSRSVPSHFEVER